MSSAAGADGVAVDRGKPSLFKLGPVFDTLDRAKKDIGLETYTLSQTTLEQVFLNIAEDQEEDTNAISIPMA